MSIRRAGSVKWGLLVGLVVLVVAGGVTYQLYQYADPRNADPAPLPRIPLNAPYIQTPQDVVDKMIEVGEITDKDFVYDLGCGDGRLVISAAVQRGCRGVGIDIESERIAEATANAERQGVADRVTFRQQDVFQVDLADADVVLVYLLPWMLEKLVDQLDKCKPGTRIVSHDFRMENVKSTREYELPRKDQGVHRVILYVTPLEKLPETRPWKLKKK